MLKLGSSVVLPLLYVATLVLWYGILLLLSEALWAPWDTAPVRPPPDHWQARLNGFFEAGAGAYLPAVVFTTLQFAIYLVTVGRWRGGLRLTSLVFAVANVFTIFGLWLLAGLLGPVTVPSFLTPDDWRYYGDYGRELPRTIVVVLNLLGLLVVPPLLVIFIKRKPRLVFESAEGNRAFRA